MTRRSPGDPKITLRKDGRYEARVELGWHDGRRRRKVLYGRTKAEVVVKLRAARRQLDEGVTPGNDRQTTEQYLKWWTTEVLPGTVKESTAYGYRSVLARNVIPHVGRVPLPKLGPQHVQTMMRTLERDGLSAQTRRNARMVLRRALGHAEKWGMVSRNAAALVDCPRGSAPKLDDALDLEQAEKLLKAARDTRFEAVVMLALTVGLRRGEALALRWSDVDLEAGTVTVSATLKRRVGVRKDRTQGPSLFLDRPKTDRAARTVAVPAATIGRLREHRRRQLEARLVAGSKWADGDFLFTTPFGRPLDPDNFTTAFQDFTEGAGLGRMRFHALRHSAATLMLGQGVPLEVISATLGHAGYAITADVYAHVGPEVQRRAADAMDDLFAQGS